MDTENTNCYTTRVKTFRHEQSAIMTNPLPQIGAASMRHWITLSLVLIYFGPAQEASPWQNEWEQTLRAAKKEGRVAVISDATTDVRDALTGPFTEKYGIAVDYFGVQGREIGPRVGAERKAGQYLWDVYIHGTTTGLTVMNPMGAFDPLEPALISPDVKDPQNWRNGILEFIDTGRRILVTTARQRGTIFINSDLVDPKEFKSYKDLLNPNWKGKLAMDDPSRSGPGQATFTFFYLHPELGPNFIRALAKQEITSLKDYAQEANMVGQGRYPVLIGTADFAVIARVRQGVPVKIIDPRQLKEGSDVSSSNGNLAVFNRAPHPNAAKIYINWYLSKEGQTSFARASGYVSSRLDVPTDHAEPWMVPIPGAIKSYGIEAVEVRRKVEALVRDVFR
jgi:iron(III) transport system substrate-binding protein